MISDLGNEECMISAHDEIVSRYVLKACPGPHPSTVRLCLPLQMETDEPQTGAEQTKPEDAAPPSPKEPEAKKSTLSAFGVAVEAILFSFYWNLFAPGRPHSLAQAWKWHLLCSQLAGFSSSKPRPYVLRYLRCSR